MTGPRVEAGAVERLSDWRSALVLDGGGAPAAGRGAGGAGAASCKLVGEEGRR
eukprot:SAG22_NODE_2019_length_3129_cov_1.934653_8_plen_53_part_00